MKKIFLAHLWGLLVLLVATQGCAMGTKRAQLTTITGTVRVVGNEPFTRLILTTTDSQGKGGSWLLVGPLQDELRRRYQGNSVTLEGAPCASPKPEYPNCFEPTRIIAR
jgi:hypothetical protein